MTNQNETDRMEEPTQSDLCLATLVSRKEIKRGKPSRIANLHSAGTLTG